MNINEQIIKNFSEKFNFIDESVVPNKYVFIGGTALMLLSMDADFEEIRGTKDYDIVLLVKDSEGNKELFKKMWEYIEEGEYDVFQTKEGTPQYYRFTNPWGARINGTEIPIGFRIITRILRVLYVLFISPFFNRSIKG